MSQIIRTKKNRQREKRELSNHSSSLKTKVYEYIRNKLLRQEWMPGGAISHREIVKETGIGFTPVREAINQLVFEGFLECHPQRGTFVTRITREDLADLYDVREALECHAIQKMIDSGVECDFVTLKNCNDSLREILDKVTGEQKQDKLDELRTIWSNTDVTFHKTLLLLSGNRLAIRLVQELRDKTRIFGHRSSMNRKDLEVIINDHHRIISALEIQDAALACEEMKKHLHRGCSIALTSYDRKRLLSAVPD
jgi:DNA-binding GntR family transcriptional regulator